MSEQPVVNAAPPQEAPEPTGDAAMPGSGESGEPREERGSSPKRSKSSEGGPTWGGYTQEEWDAWKAEQAARWDRSDAQALEARKFTEQVQQNAKDSYHHLRTELLHTKAELAE
eukprot:10666976-Alexandrium_andersonii.AAC.1